MKKNSFGAIVFLVLLALATFWFNHEEQADDSANHSIARTSENYLLAVSWQPAFCEQRPNRPECRSQRNNRFDARNFSLHGLWPQPAGTAYCGVEPGLVSIDKSGRWRNLPKLELSDGLRKELTTKMPGYRSYLHRHEWYKHGTCMPEFTPQAYFASALSLLDQLNSNGVRNLLAENIGARLNFGNVRHAVQHAYGKRAGSRFILDCYRDDGRRIIHEMKFSLNGNLSPGSSLKELLSKGVEMPRSCPAGIVDPVGLQ